MTKLCTYVLIQSHDQILSCITDGYQQNSSTASASASTSSIPFLYRHLISLLFTTKLTAGKEGGGREGGRGVGKVTSYQR